jgi:hypothetical protein
MAPASRFQTSTIQDRRREFRPGVRPDIFRTASTQPAPRKSMTDLNFVKFGHFAFNIKQISHFFTLPLWWIDGTFSKTPLWKAILCLEKFTDFAVNPS